MPIGKNAIKRVENNGYSNVKTAAPDMENSVVIPALSEEVMEKLVKPVEEKTAKKRGRKPAVKSEPAKAEPGKKHTTKKVSTKKTVQKQAIEEKTAVERVELGTDMPYYLL